MMQMKQCKTCGRPIAANAKTCPFCGGSNRPPVYEKVWFWLLIGFVLLTIIFFTIQLAAVMLKPSSNHSRTEGEGTSSSSQAVSAPPSPFDGDCGITASAEMGTDIIGFPTLTISIHNTSDKDISAMQFYAVPYDVYGEEVTGVFGNSQRHL